MTDHTAELAIQRSLQPSSNDQQNYVGILDR